MNAFGGMFAAAGYHQAAAAAAAAHHMHHQAYTASAAAAAAHHQYKVPRLYFKIPRVLPYKEQREKFETDDYFKKLARESEARYTGFRDRPLHERQAKFQQACREGQIELAILSNGFTFCLMWNVLENGYLDPHAMTRIDFSKERGRVYIDSPVILNVVCLRWKGYINLEKLDGVGGMKFDEDSARIEDAIMQQQVESYKHDLRDWDEQQQRHRAALQQARSASSQLTSTPSTEEQQQQHTVTTA